MHIPSGQRPTGWRVQWASWLRCQWPTVAGGGARRGSNRGSSRGKKYWPLRHSLVAGVFKIRSRNRESGEPGLLIRLSVCGPGTMSRLAYHSPNNVNQQPRFRGLGREALLKCKVLPTEVAARVEDDTILFSKLDTQEGESESDRQPRLDQPTTAITDQLHSRANPLQRHLVYQQRTKHSHSHPSHPA